MARRHQLEIDGKVLVDIRNTWLPPTTALTVELDAGTHSVRALLEKDDRPTLYYKPVDDRTVFRSPVADAVDYTLFAGTPDEVIAGYRTLTGDAPLMPDWALGYIHCRERFHSQEEILATADRFRTGRLPVFVRAGSILPLAEGELQSTVEARCADWEIHIYAGADGSFTLYEDEGTNYRYEQGACATVRLTWDDARRTLTLHPRQGSFEGMRTERPIRLILHDKGQPPVTRPVTYDGRAVTVSW